MAPHPVISLVLVAVFAGGSIMPPRYACRCADGTMSVEVGRLFCEASVSCATNLKPADGADRTRDVPTLCVLEDCLSSPLGDDAAVLIDRNERGEINPSACGVPVIHPAFELHAPIWPLVSMRTICLDADGRTHSSEPFQLRSVILLV